VDNVSKLIGWKHKVVPYPTLKEVWEADAVQLATWYRFLDSPTNEEQRKVMKLVVDLVKGDRKVEKFARGLYKKDG